MSSKTLSELMTIKTDSPAIDKFDPTEAVNLGWCVIKLLLNPSGRKRRPNFCRSKQLQSGTQKKKKNPKRENDTTVAEKDTTTKTGKDTSAEMDDPEDTQDIESEYEEDSETDSDIERTMMLSKVKRKIIGC
uniref:Uncharacterized protein n=1 Tax=Magallana gigas TaxID=29159 RepID=A0A8W8MJN3_MAGGI